MPHTAATVGYGGSYGGSLAAWARLLYPQTFQAALASSSVVRYMAGGESFQRTRYETWRAVTASVRAVGGAACAARVALGFATLQGRASWSGEGRAQLAAAARCAGPAVAGCRWWAGGRPMGSAGLAPSVLQRLIPSPCWLHAQCLRSLCPNNVLEGPADIEGLVALLSVAWWGAFQSLQPATNPVPAACQRILTAFPATPLGAVAAISNFTRSQIMASWRRGSLLGRGLEVGKGAGARCCRCALLTCSPGRSPAPPTLPSQKNATCIKDSALPFSAEEERPDEPVALAYMAQCCMQGTPIRCLGGAVVGPWWG